MTYDNNTSYAPKDGEILRMSKSSFMGYNKCPRQYWWRYIGMPDVRSPATPQMIRGTEIHAIIDDYYNNPDDYIVGEDADPAVHSFIEIEQQKTESGLFETIESERRVEIMYEFEDEDGLFQVYLTGFIDAVMTAPGDGLCLTEVKTGNFNSGKLGRTRKELAFYAFILGLMGEEVTHFGYIAPDSTDEKLFLSESNKKGKFLWTGVNQGLMLVEKVNKRTTNALKKSLHKTVKGLYAKEWPMKWSEYFCVEWCDFSLACEQELNGIAEPPM